MKTKLFRLEAIFEDYEHVRGMNVLGASDVETLSVGKLLQLANRPPTLNKIRLGYDDVKGRESLRKLVAESYPRASLTARNVLITVGASEAILLALHASLKPGDTALVCNPAYQGLYEMAKTAGANVVRYDYVEGNGFDPDLDRIRRMFDRSPPRVLVLNSPHNPTGKVLSKVTLDELLKMAKAAKTRVISDEVFYGIRIDQEVEIESAAHLSREAVVIGCLSKVYGLAGLRIGWLVGPQNFINECKRTRYYTSLSPPSVVQQLAQVALEKRAYLVKRGQHNVDQNYGHARKWLKSQEKFFDWSPPQGGTVMLLKLKLAVNTEQFARHLAHTSHVFLVPCTSAFGMKERFLRLGLGGNPRKFKQGLKTVSEYLRKRKWAGLPKGKP
jgi:aspartate/methionine/tyrosine aminotransferase